MEGDNTDNADDTNMDAGDEKSMEDYFDEITGDSDDTTTSDDDAGPDDGGGDPTPVINETSEEDQKPEAGDPGEGKEDGKEQANQNSEQDTDGGKAADSAEADQLPDDPEALKAMVRDRDQTIVDLDHSVKSQKGRVRGLNKRLSRISQSVGDARSKVADAVNSASLPDEAKTDEDREFEGHSQDIVNQIDKRARHTTQTVMEQVLDPLAEAAKAVDSETLSDNDLELLELHPDAQTVVTSDDFQAWLSQQAPMVRDAFDRGGLEDSDWLLNQYKQTPGFANSQTSSDDDEAAAKAAEDSDSDTGASDTNQKPNLNKGRETRMKRATASPGSSRETSQGRETDGSKSEFENEFDSLVARDDMKRARQARAG